VFPGKFVTLFLTFDASSPPSVCSARSEFNSRSHPGPIGRLPLDLALLLALTPDQVRSLTPGRCGPSIAGGEPILLLKDDKGERGGSVAENGDPESPR